MDEVSKSSDQEGSNASEVMESLGVEPEQKESGDSKATDSLVRDDDPHGVKKRLSTLDARHKRELRAMQEQMSQLQAQLGKTPEHTSSESSYNSSSPQGMSIEEQIQRGVRYALQAKEDEERKAKEAERMSHVHREYQRLNDEFDKASDKYEDFDNVVRGHDVPFTAAMRDALLLVDNPADVVYKLGKNKEELRRISQLQPVEQAREVNKLSFALMGGNSQKPSSAPRTNPMSNIKANPVTSQAITDKTPPSTIRARMKAGTWK